VIAPEPVIDAGCATQLQVYNSGEIEKLEARVDCVISLFKL